MGLFAGQGSLISWDQPRRDWHPRWHDADGPEPRPATAQPADSLVAGAPIARGR
ncbi:hypothetical protein MY4824_003876 [Beauveria thailandica]